MRYAWLIGGPVLFREAVQLRFEAAGLQVFDSTDDPDDPTQTIVVSFCSTEADWLTLEALDGYLGKTAVVDQILPTLYLRALRSGIGVVHVDTKSETIASVALAAGHGEAVLPMEIARLLAEGATASDLDASHDLDVLETDLIQSIAKGETLASIASRYFYSERTLRRRLQSAYIKLGVQDRAGAIQAAGRLGLL